VRLAAITLAALAGRVAYVFAARRHTPAWGDSFSYNYGANLLAHGKGFIDPLRYSFFGISTPSAYHPPVYTVYLALWTKVGVGTIFGHRLVSCLLGAAVVAVLGLVGRELGSTPAIGERIGLVAAVLAALTPALWVNDGALLSEPAAELTVALVVLALLRYRARPSARGAALVGLWCALAALSRAELVLLFPLLAIPMWRWTSGSRTKRVLGPIIAFGAIGVLVIGPWVGYNLSRFQDPVYISTGLGATLGGGACDAAFYGPKLGYWDASPACGASQVAITLPPSVNPATPAGHAELERVARAQLSKEGDESVRDTAARHEAVDYIKAHKSRLPIVVAARVGRLWGVFRPWQTATFDATIEGRGLLAARLAMIGYWILAVLSIPGLLLLKRRKQMLAPFLALGFIATLAAALSFGVQRYRAPFDTVMPVLAAVALVALWSRRRPPPIPESP
jgi:4-amino-4-deoxy-L-arabinose transferase-like glycosyltransferase